MKIVDSSVLIAFLNESDALHDRAMRQDFNSSVINQLVFAEVANVLHKRVHNKKLVVTALSRLLKNTPVLALSDEEMELSLDLFSKHYPKLSFTDSSLAVQSMRLGAELLTFDEDLLKIV